MPHKKTTKRSLHTRFHRVVRDSVIPHKRNQYRPHLTRQTGIAVVLTFVLTVQLVPYLSSGPVLGVETGLSSQSLLETTNTERKARKLAPLYLSDQLSNAAKSKGRDMLKKQYWAHTSPTGTNPWFWVKKEGYRYTFAGENLAKGFRTASGTVAAWMGSIEHRKNVLSENYQDVGFAVLEGEMRGEDTTIIVALYAAPVGGVSNTGAGTSVLRDAEGSTNLITRFGIGVQSMTPGMLGSIVLLLLASGVALLTHANRKNLPKSLRTNWKRHHGLYQAIGMVSLAVILITLYGNGSL